jgi:hypothetical protein
MVGGEGALSFGVGDLRLDGWACGDLHWHPMFRRDLHPQGCVSELQKATGGRFSQKRLGAVDSPKPPTWE